LAVGLRSVQKGKLIGELEVNHHADAFVELKESGGFLARQSFFDKWKVAGAKLIELFVDLEPTPHENERIVVGHGSPILGVSMQHRELLVIDVLEVRRILLVNGPELDGLGFGHWKVLSNEFLFLFANVVAHQLQLLGSHPL